jgi:hypothetical protein
METIKMNKLVYFQNMSDNEPQYGIMLDNENILCLCCGGIVEKGEYEILEWCEWFNLSQAMKDGLII